MILPVLGTDLCHVQQRHKLTGLIPLVIDAVLGDLLVKRGRLLPP